MIEYVDAGVTTNDWHAEARRRAVAAGRRRRAKKASTEWPDFAPPVAMSDGPLGAVQSADREIARQTAIRARAVAEFAATRPSTADRAQGEPGAMSAERWAARHEILRPVSEWAARELVVALSISSEAAEALLNRSLTLVHRLPGTLAALEAGALHPGHLWPLLDKVAPIQDDRIRAEVEADLLRWSAGRVTTPAQLAAKARREVAKRDARDAARQLQRALEERGVHLRPHAVDGMATVTMVATMPEARALYQALIACTETLDEGGDPRTRGMKMVDCLLDLVLRPGEHDLPPVQVLLTVVASMATLLGGDQPGEIDGHVVPGEMIRQVLVALTAQHWSDPAPCDQAAAQSTAAAFPHEQAEQEERERWLLEMERRVLAGELDDPADYADHDLVDWRETPVQPGAWLDDAREQLDEVCAERLVDERPPESATDGLPPGGVVRREPTPAERSANGLGWWAAADEAIDEAGQAMLQVRRKLAHAHRLVGTAAAADAADESAWQTGSTGRLTEAGNALTALLSATDAQRGHLADLLGTTGGGGLADRPRIALTDALSGALLALTDLPGLRRAGTCGRPACRRVPARCSHDLDDRPGLGRPDPTDAYQPSAALDRWTRARDRRCRFPGCRRRVPRGGELDHHRPYPGGPTSAENLVGYCTADHRGKHQAPGWEHRLDPDGTLTVTTPTGLAATTSPPPY